MSPSRVFKLRIFQGLWPSCKLLYLLCNIIAIVSAQSYSSNSYSSSSSENDFDPSASFDNLALQCRGEWKHPPDCSGGGNSSCDYRAAWEYRDEDDQIVFTISTKNRNKWTGIGFSEQQAMPETDAILGLVEESGRFFLMDSWLQAYEAPPLDPIQNLYNQTAWRENGITTLKFSRPRQTGDSRDYQFSDTACPYFIFPVMGGVFNAVNKRIRKHEATPVVSERRICVRSCRPPTIPPVISTSLSSTSTTTMATTSSTSSSSSSAGSVIPTTTSKSTYSEDGGEESGNNEVHGSSSPPNDHPTTTGEESTRLYRVELKMLHFNDLLTPEGSEGGPKKPNVHSEEYQEMLSTLEQSLYHELKAVFERVRRLEVSEVINDSPSLNKDETSQSTLVIFELTVGQKRGVKGENTDAHDDTQSLTLALSSLIRDRRIGSQFTVDSGYLVVAPKDAPGGRFTTWINNGLASLGFTSRFTEDEQKWIIIGAGISALVLLALIQALCMFCRCSGSQSGDHLPAEDNYLHEKDNVDKQWKEYNSSAEQYGYGGVEEYVTANGHYGHKSNSLHKNYGGRGGGGREEYHHQPYHPSLDRRHYEQQQQLQQQNGRSRGSGHHSHHHEDHHHHRGDPRNGSGRGQPQPSYSMQPDYYFMPHQRKYSSEVVRVFVDYDGHQ